MGPNAIAADKYSWDTVTASYTSDDSRRIFGGGGVDHGVYGRLDHSEARSELIFTACNSAIDTDRSQAYLVVPTGKFRADRRRSDAPPVEAVPVLAA